MVAGELLWIRGWERERYISSPDIQQFMKIKTGGKAFK
jgi:hypothetical protein